MSEHLTPEIFETESTFRDWLVKTRQLIEMWETKRKEEGKPYQAAHLRIIRSELDFTLLAYKEDR